MGECARKENAKPLVTITDKVNGDSKADGTYKDNVYGSYVHGIFDKEEVAEAVVTSIGKKKGLDVSEMTGVDFAEYKEKQYDLLADGLREYLDMEKIYKILEEGI